MAYGVEKEGKGTRWERFAIWWYIRKRMSGREEDGKVRVRIGGGKEGRERKDKRYENDRGKEKGK